MPADGQKNRAFRSKSSEAPMRCLWAFRCNPLRGGSSKPAQPDGRNFVLTKLRGLPPSA
ncbi:MAG: hypothetical protein LBK44_02195 [Spirochaetales bacterium]|nr:hypothetical protein [Spirochaetales bacterium]